MTERRIDLPLLESQIVVIRGRQVLLDSVLADLYGVETRALLQALRRNADRFPEDFVFQMENHELKALRSQFVISKDVARRGGRRYRPYAFTEQGVAMLSSVLSSSRAVQVNIEIMRAFVRLRRAALVSRQLVAVVNELSRRVDTHDSAIRELLKTISQLVEEPVTKKRPIGFTADLDEVEPPHPSET